MIRRVRNHMEAEQVLKLFDSCWSGPKVPKLFHSCWFGRKLLELFDSCLLMGPKVAELFDSWSEPTGGSSTAMLMAYKMDESKATVARNLRIRSMSDRCLGVNMSREGAAASKGSEIIKPKLQKILSGKDVVVFCREGAEEENGEKTCVKKRRLRRKNGREGSLDLGFVFNEEDKNPGLISIIPGLQMAADDDDEEEAWSRNSKCLVDWKVPSVQNEIRMKDHLRIWAHTVASKVR